MRLYKKQINLYLAGFAAMIASCSGSEDIPKPNVVIILADDMGWGDLRVNGNSIVETPALDRLAAQSLSFNRFYVCPLSAPTRSEMLTGRYFLRTGVSSVDSGFENMRTGEVTVAEVLKDNGYATGCFGKWHNGGYFQQHPNRQGFDEFVGFCVGHLGYYFDSWFMQNDDEVKSTGYTTDYFTDRALDFIGRNSDKQFFCYVPYNVPHSPFQVPEKYFDKYYSKGSDSLLACVYGMMENMDGNISRILNRLDELKIRDNTIVIFFSDNGPNTDRYNGNMKGKKGSVDEGGVRVPFYISWPDKIKPGITEQLAQDIDILPTVLSLCGIKYDPVNPLDGLDMSGIISGKTDLFDRYIFSRQAYRPITKCNGSVRNNKYRLIRSANDTLLYDLEADPSQKVDISGTHKELAKNIFSVLKLWEDDLVSKYLPVTTIEAGFEHEKKFILPVQDAILSGNIKFSSIFPNQANTQNWIQNGDSIYWEINLDSGGKYLAEIQYGCSAAETGSKMLFRAGSGNIPFVIDKPFESQVLPDRDYVKRGESYERTWTWMAIGNIALKPGHGQVVIKLINRQKNEAGLFKAIRFTKIQNSDI